MPGENEVERLLDAYPRVFFACHQRHVRDPESGVQVSAHQASILSHLDSVEPTSVSGLADHMGVTVSTMSLSVKRLEDRGYVRRSPDPRDRRAVQLRLTPAGEALKRAQRVLDPERVAELLAGLSSDRREEGLRGLEILAEAADAMGRGFSSPEDERKEGGS